MKSIEQFTPSLEELLSLAVECRAIDCYREDGEVVCIQMADEEYRIPVDSVVLFLETVIHYRRRLEAGASVVVPHQQVNKVPSA